MSEIEFYYNCSKTIIQCRKDEKIKDIIQRYLIKIEKNKDEVYFLYGGGLINEELTFEELSNSQDKERNKMTIIVNDEQSEDFSNIGKSKYIICPKCKENIKLVIKDHKISLYDCKNSHKIDDIPFNVFENTQYIDESKVICQICKIANKSQTYENKFFICTTCQINICPLCKNKHDKTHNILDYEHKYFICNKHNESYISFCQDCKKDICVMDENDHVGHKFITYGGIMSDKNDLKVKLNNFKIKINDFKEDIKNIIIQLNNLIENIDSYYNIYENIVNNYENKNRNYLILQNINDLNNYNTKLIEIINKIVGEKNIKNKFNYMIDIYNKMTLKDKYPE